MSEFELCDSSWTKMSRPSGTTITGNIVWPWSETVDKLIDGSTSTKYCPNGSLPIIITITLWSTVDFSIYNKYKRYTANDWDGRDPVSWTIEASNDWSNWDTVSTVTNATITTNRYSLAWTWSFTTKWKVSAVFVWTTKVRPSWWKPWANTIAYYPFKNDIKDYSGNWHNWYIARWTTTFSDNACQFNTLRCNDTLFSNYSGDITILAYVLSATSTAGFWFATDWTRYPIWKFLENNFWIYNGWREVANWQSLTFPNLLVAVKLWTSVTLYIWDTVNATWTTNKSIPANTNWICIWGYGSNNETMKVWNLIVETKARTAQEVLDYYNQTKWDYWIS